MTIASSPTIEGLTKLANQYWHTTTIVIDGQTVSNSKGIIKNVVVEQKRNRFYLKHTN